MPDQPDLIDKLLPASRIHLIGGNSNAGKTRFLLPMLLEWQAGMPILGLESNPVPWAYVVGDRLLVEAHDTCRAMAIDPDRIPMIPAFGEKNKRWESVINEAAKRKIGFLVWEGFSDFCRGEKKKDVREYLSSLAAYCHSSDFFNNSLTILGVMEAPKLKSHERYDDPRQRISGLASWGYHASSVLVVEAARPLDMECPDRILHCSLKNTTSFSVAGSFDDNGRLRFLPRQLTPEELLQRRKHVN